MHPSRLCLPIAFVLMGSVAATAQPPSAAQTPAQEADSVLSGSEYTKLPETWELVYDIAMKPYIDDYKTCLGYTDLVFRAGVQPNVEYQHRQDLPRCAKVKAQGIAQSNAALQRRGRSHTMPADKVEEAFDTMGYIHIQRGRNLDQQFTLQERAIEERRRQCEAQIAARDGAAVDPADPAPNEISETKGIK